MHLNIQCTTTDNDIITHKIKFINKSYYGKIKSKFRKDENIHESPLFSAVQDKTLFIYLEISRCIRNIH